jgi:hypothetical protein
MLAATILMGDSMRHARIVGSFLLVLAGTVISNAARADVIDGEWCFSDGRHLSIRGPEIVTPAGHRLAGDYSRHSFSYAIPSGEPGTGQTVSMLLLNENTVQLHSGAAGEASAPQIWLRCAAPTSDAAALRHLAGR